MENVIGCYVRVSTQEQAESGLSLDAQAAALARFADARGMDHRLYVDAGASGSTRERRPNLAALVADVAAGRLAAVAVTRLDRLSRSTADALAIAAELERAGVPLLDLSCPVADATAFGRFSFTLRAAVAALERGLIAERTSAALRAKAARGEWTGGVPAMGLQQVGDRLEPHPWTLAVPATIRDLRAAGYSFRAIANGLEGAGIPTARGGKWAAETVRLLATNPRITKALETCGNRPAPTVATLPAWVRIAALEIVGESEPAGVA